MSKKSLQDTPNFDLEHQAIAQYGSPVAGVDEAGRGPWAGPVVAAAVVLDPDSIPDGLNDSKKLSEKKRELLFDEIYEVAEVGVGIADVSRIDQDNILQASLWAMSEAVRQLKCLPVYALIDGNKCPQLDCDMQAVVKGDSRSVSIAAASIIAKVTRDRMMDDLAVQFPDFGWERNKGYGTKQHVAALEKIGVTEHHRKSFKPIKALLCEE